MKRVHLPFNWDPAKPLMFHAMAHSNNDEQLFRDRNDYAAFLRGLVRASKESGATVCAYCPEYNHYHLLLFCMATQLGAFMHRLQTTLAGHFRAKYGGVGHVFFRPYQAFAKVTRAAILDCSWYIHGNPLKDGVFRDLFRFEHSSLRAYAGFAKPPEFLDTLRILSLLDPGPESAQIRYRQGIIQWASEYPAVLARFKKIIERTPDEQRYGFQNTERLRSLISLTQTLLARSRTERPDGGASALGTSGPRAEVSRRAQAEGDRRPARSQPRGGLQAFGALPGG